MSAIVGIYNLDNRAVQCVDVERMVEILAHRGPDGSAVWSEGPVGLGHRMLHTTQESLHETLPFVDESRVLVITADARVDNRDELIKSLGLPDVTPGQLSDSELILAAYAKWGEDCPDHLLGDFAFVIWDGHHRKLFCARDHFGVKPFYYYHADRKLFAFGTEIKALLCLEQVPNAINEERIAEYLIAVHNDQESTFYKRILRLPPAHSLTVTEDGFQLQRYWKLDASRRLELASDAEYDARFRDVFFEAVRCRLRTPPGQSQLGSFLSGGIDSSAVVCAARDIRGKDTEPLPIFSTVFDVVKECDERPYINAVLGMGGLQPHWIVGETRSALMDIEKVLWHEDEPFVAPNLCSSWVQYQVARDSGVRVLLDGHGGDETIGYGYSRIGELERAGKWQILWHELKALQRNGLLEREKTSARHIMSRLISRHLPPLRLLRRVSSAVSRRLSRLGRSMMVSDVIAVPEWRRIVKADFAESTNLDERYWHSQHAEPTISSDDKEYNECVLNGALQSLAMETLDKCAAAAQVEARYPMWDKRLVEFCLSLPSDQKLRQGWSRLIIRRALQDVLPSEVQWRGSKVNFAAEVEFGVRTHEKAWLESLGKDGLKASAKYIETKAIKESAENLLTNNLLANNGSDVQIIVRAVCLEVWLRAAKNEMADTEENYSNSKDYCLNATTLGDCVAH